MGEGMYVSSVQTGPGGLIEKDRMEIPDRGKALVLDKKLTDYLLNPRHQIRDNGTD